MSGKGTPIEEIMDFIVGIGFDLYQPSAGSASQVQRRCKSNVSRLQVS